MRPTQSIPPSQPIAQPNCTECGALMWLTSIEPEKPDHDRRTFVCPRCQDELVEVVEISIVHFMETVSEYLAEAIKFERMAGDAVDEKTKAAFKNLADAYRKLAIKRAKELGYPIPPPPKPNMPTGQR